MKIGNRITLVVASLATALSFGATAMAAGTCYWTGGGGSGSWNNPSNWSIIDCSGAGGIPGDGDDLVFPAVAANKNMTNDIPVATLQIVGSMDVTGGNYTLAGNSFTLTPSGTDGVKVEAGGNTLTLSGPTITLGKNQTFSSFGTSQLILGNGAGAINNNGYDLTLYTEAPSNGNPSNHGGINLNQNLSGSGKMIKRGVGELYITSTNQSWTGGTDVQAGSITTMAGGGQYFGLSGNFTMHTGATLNLNGNSEIIGSLSGDGGTIVFGPGVGAGVGVEQVVAATYSGDIQGGSNSVFLVGGTQKLTLDRPSISFGGLVNADIGSQLKLSNTTMPADLEVSGTVELLSSSVRVITAYSNGTLNLQGQSNAATGLAMQNLSGMSVDIPSLANYGKITVSGPISLGPTNINFAGAYIPNSGNVFDIIVNNSGSNISNTFVGLPQGATTTHNGTTLVAAYNGGVSGEDFTLTAQNLTASTVSLGSSVNPSSISQSVTFTATVTGAGGTPSGTVTFKDGVNTLVTANLNGSGVATFTTSALAYGPHSITAVYSGDSIFSTSTSNVVLQFIADTNISFVSSLNPSTPGASVNFTVTLSAIGRGEIPAGSVTFKDGATVLATATLDGSGAASYSTSALSLGSHNIVVNYGGSRSFSANEASLTQMVNAVVSGGGGGGGGGGMVIVPLNTRSESSSGETTTTTTETSNNCGNYSDIAATDPKCSQYVMAAKFGFTQSYFAPKDIFDRAASLKTILFLTNAGFDSTKDYCVKVNPFLDVFVGRIWVDQFACFAKGKNYITGYTAGVNMGKFLPAKQVTEAEFSAMLLRIVDTSHQLEKTQKDNIAANKAWYLGYVDYLKGKGVTINPDNLMNRSDALDLMYRMYKAGVVSVN